MEMNFENFVDIDKTIGKKLFEGVKFPWEVLGKIKDYIVELGNSLDSDYYDYLGDNVWIAKNAKVDKSATIIGPCIIDLESEIRPSAYLRGNVIVGKNCVIGNSCEIKNSIIFDKSQIPHFNYVGDSILGYHSHLGAGVVISNLKNDKSNICIKNGDMVIETGLRKMGAIVADNVDVGCNSVLFPGTIIGRGSSIYPLVSVRGVILENRIVKSMDNIVVKEFKING